MPLAKNSAATLLAQGPLPMINVLQAKVSPFINLKKLRVLLDKFTDGYYSLDILRSSMR